MLVVPGCRQEMQGAGGPSRGESRGGRHPEMIPYCRETGRCEESQGRADSPEGTRPWGSVCRLSCPRTGRGLTVGWSRPAWAGRQAQSSPHWSLGQPSWPHCYHWSGLSWGWRAGHCWRWWRPDLGTPGTRVLGVQEGSRRVLARYNWVHCN